MESVSLRFSRVNFFDFQINSGFFTEYKSRVKTLCYEITSGVCEGLDLNISPRGDILAQFTPKCKDSISVMYFIYDPTRFHPFDHNTIELRISFHFHPAKRC